MKAKFFGLCLACIILVNYSCKKWLDEKPSTSLSTPETLQDLQAILDGSTVLNFKTTTLSPELASDEIFLSGVRFNSSNEREKSIYTWQRYVDNFDSDWRSCYLPIFNVNICLENLAKIQRTSTNTTSWDNVKGSALFFRSYYFLQLVWTYSKGYNAITASTDLGISLRTVSDVNILSTRSTVLESYNKIIADTKESISLLPNLPIHPLRPSKAAAYALLARTYLSMNLYDSAFKYSDLSLAIKSDLMDYNGDADVSNINLPEPFKRFNKETIFYTEMNLYYSAALASNAFIDTLLMAGYSGNDLRKNAFFGSSQGYHMIKGTYSAQTNVLYSGLSTDEILLIRAECKIRLGDKNGGLNDINVLAAKRYSNLSFVPFTATTLQNALTIVLAERRKELVMRGLRWSDIKRLNMAGGNITLQRNVNGQNFQLNPNDPKFALLIPQDIIEITGMPQNPGW